MYVYETISGAINGLKERGYKLDFNLKENRIICEDEKFQPEDFEITEFYRFEGETDPSDEAVVYAIESNNGKKGVLVNAFGIYADPLSDDIIKKLSFHKK